MMARALVSCCSSMQSAASCDPLHGPPGHPQNLQTPRAPESTCAEAVPDYPDPGRKSDLAASMTAPPLCQSAAQSPLVSWLHSTKNTVT